MLRLGAGQCHGSLDPKYWGDSAIFEESRICGIMGVPKLFSISEREKKPEYL